MRVQIPTPTRPPRWVRHTVGSLMLMVFFANPAIQARVSSVACTFVHSMKVIKKFDDTIGLRNIIQFS